MADIVIMGRKSCGIFPRTPITKVDIYTKEIELEPDNPSSYIERGISLLEYGRKQFPKAIDDFSKALELDPGNSRAYARRGLAFNCVGKFEKACDDLRRAVEIDPRDTRALAQYGFALIALERFDGAIDNLNRAVEINPEDSYAYCYRGAAFLSLGNLKDALKDLNESIKKDYENIGAYYNRVGVYFDLCRFEDALSDLEKIARSRDSIHTPKGYALMMLGKFDEAEGNLRMALEENPVDFTAQNNLGLLFNYTDRAGDAVDILTKAISFDPECAAAYSNRGTSHRLMDKVRLAQQDYEKTIELFCNVPEEKRMVSHNRFAVRAERGLNKLDLLNSHQIEEKAIADGVLTQDMLSCFFRFEK